MGQYYNIALEDNPLGIITVYDRTLDGEYTMAKLMGHSWWNNDMVAAICQKIYKHPMRVAWMGDYGNMGVMPNGLSIDLVDKLYTLCWGDYATYAPLSRKDGLCFLNNGKYLINHTAKTYVDCTEYYYDNCDKDGWLIHPLPLLTAIGNGQGGGDYGGVNADDVGLWAWDEISIEDEPRYEYLKQSFIFKED